MDQGYGNNNNTMKLLKIDNKLVALNVQPFEVFNITDNLVGHTVKKITFSQHKYAILTLTNIYYLHYKCGFELVDITSNIEPHIKISDIKFVTDTNFSATDPYYIGIITITNGIVMYNIERKQLRLLNANYQEKNHDIVAVSASYFCYIYKDGNKYIATEYTCTRVFQELYKLDNLPTIFMSPSRMLCGSDLVYYNYSNRSLEVLRNNISQMYNINYYCTKDNIVRKDMDHCGAKINGNIIDYDYKCMITFDTDTVTIKYFQDRKSNEVTHNIAKSYYHAENLFQYSNDTWNIRWTIDSHHLFGKYTDKLVRLLLKYHKYSKLRKYIPKGILFMVIQFIL